MYVCLCVIWGSVLFETGVPKDWAARKDLRNIQKRVQAGGLFAVDRHLCHHDFYLLLGNRNHEVHSVEGKRRGRYRTGIANAFKPFFFFLSFFASRIEIDAMSAFAMCHVPCAFSKSGLIVNSIVFVDCPSLSGIVIALQAWRRLSEQRCHYCDEHGANSSSPASSVSVPFPVSVNW